MKRARSAENNIACEKLILVANAEKVYAIEARYRLAAALRALCWRNSAPVYRVLNSRRREIINGVIPGIIHQKLSIGSVEGSFHSSSNIAL